MKTPHLSRRIRALANCAPITEEQMRDRSMRSAVFRARTSDEFANQQSFDQAVAGLVRSIPIPPDIAEWFSAKDLTSPSKWTWKKTARNPAVLAIGIALVVIAGVLVFQFVGRLNDFPGSATARKLLTIAGSTRSVLLDPVSADAGTLSDLFFMKHGLEHYDVPGEFADFRTIGCRVFEDDIVFENAAADCPKIRELGRHVVMFQPMFHEKQITQGPSISTHRIEENRSCRAGNRQ